MSRLVTGIVMLLALCIGAPQSAADPIGIVLMHGKTGSPNAIITGLASALQAAGYLVDTPEMC
jgi:hypothetical protein